MKLFLPNKYPVIVCNEGSSVAFCSVWNQDNIIAKASPALVEKVSIIGTLYSRQGVSVILRNLALNPQIRTLVLWGFGTLSNTVYGTSGSGILRAFFESGVGEDRMVVGTSFEIGEEIDLEVLELIRENVELVDLSEVALGDLVDAIPDGESGAYMEPREFDEPVANVIATLPSEGVGFSVHGRTVLDSWHKLVFQIMRFGVVKGSQYGMEQRELIGAQWTVYDESGDFPTDVPSDWPPELRETVGATEAAISEYHDVFLSSDTKDGVVYTYGSRLRNWKLGDETVDQVKAGLIGVLKYSPDSRRAVATTLIPPNDVYAEVTSPPCLISVQCLQSNGKLHLLATFRSHDIFKAAIPNAFGLIALHDEVARETGFARGSLCIESHSAHIYAGDFDAAEKLIDCAFLGRDGSVFDAADADRRGNILIRVEDERIILEHRTPIGDLIGEYSGGSALEIVRKIGDLEVISQVGHALDIGLELQKAEDAIRSGVGYIQDRVL